MSQNTEQYQLTTSTSSLNNNKRPSSHLHFWPTSSHFDTPTSVVNTIENNSPSSPTVNDVCVDGQNNFRNASTTMKINDGSSPNVKHLNDKYSFTLDLTSPVVKVRKDCSHNFKTQIYNSLDNMIENDQEDLHSPFELDVPLCENQSLKTISSDFLIDRMLKDDSNTSQNRSSNQLSYVNVLNHSSPLLTPSSDHHDIDALSDAGTYVIEDDIDIARDDEDIEQKNDAQEKISQTSTTSSSFKRYATSQRNRHGTFDIHGVSSKLTHNVNRPIVDLNVSTHDLSSPLSSSSSSSLLSLPTESDNSIRKEPEDTSHYMIDDKSSTSVVYARQQSNKHQCPTSSSQNPIKPAEYFVISPTFETKTFPNTINVVSCRKTDTRWKPKSTKSIIPTKDTNSQISPSCPLSARSNQNDTEKCSFRQQQTCHHESKKLSFQNSDYISSSSKTSFRPHTIIYDQTNSSPFQRNSLVRQTMPPNTQHNRPTSTSTTKSADKNDEILSSHPSLTKVYMNKSFALRRQRSNLTPSTTKTVQQQTTSKPLSARQTVKLTNSVPSTSLSIGNSSGQTNRAVELRRARAQAKIEELAQRTKQQLQKTEQYNDTMSASWHSNASSNTSKKDFSHLRVNSRATLNTTQKQDLLKTRTIPPSSHHRSSSASPNSLGETTTKTSKYRKAMVSSVTNDLEYQKMNGSTHSEGVERCDSLRDDGQRLAIKLIQLSSGILAKLKPDNTADDNDSNVEELEQLVDRLQTVNRTLSIIDASLADSASDKTQN